ncbi:hypothetical protein SAMN05421508_101515 [Caenispirillum bisanense]|uniref:Uncharacterized protein n=1 Tax=Caenispirillum bisanense TaxID=414052 RepID=A0A286G455_9PROT|nr:hypothetical protein SAMN05421508_101515 [Caenispirillum bisanense]
MKGPPRIFRSGPFVLWGQRVGRVDHTDRVTAGVS